MRAMISHTLDQAGPLGRVQCGPLTSLAAETGLVTPEAVKIFSQLGSQAVEAAVDAFTKETPDAATQTSALDGLNDVRQALWLARSQYSQAYDQKARIATQRATAYNQHSLPGLEAATRAPVTHFTVPVLPVQPENHTLPHQTEIKSGHRVSTSETAGAYTMDFNGQDPESSYRLLNNVDAMLHYCIGMAVGGPTGAAITQLVQQRQPRHAGWILAGMSGLPYSKQELTNCGQALSQSIKTATIGRGRDIDVRADSTWQFTAKGLLGEHPVNYTEFMYDFSAEFPYQWDNSRLLERIPGVPAIVTSTQALPV